MNNFSFNNTTAIYFGKGQIKAAGQVIPKGKKVLLVYGGGSIKKNGVYDQVKNSLDSNGHFWDEFGGIESNPQYDTLMRAVKKVQDEGFDYLLAVGGGSVIDGTKFIAVASLYNGEDPWDLLAKQIPAEKAVLLSCILTLPATGSESNTAAVVSRGVDKLFFYCPFVRPQFAILDPAVTLSLSKRQISNGVVDAFIHVMEQYLTYPVNAKVQDRFSEGLLSTLLEEGPKALENPEDLEVRSNIMWSATMALNELIGQGVPQDWSTHMIGHELTGLYGVDHARSLSIVLPGIMKYKRADKKEKILQYGERVLGILSNSGPEEELINAVIEKTKDFFRKMQMPLSFSEIDLKGDSIEQAIGKTVANLEKHGRLNLGEKQDINPIDVKKILELSK